MVIPWLPYGMAVCINWSTMIPVILSFHGPDVEPIPTSF